MSNKIINRFDELNKKILKQCKTINDIEENIPFSEEVLDDMEYEKFFIKLVVLIVFLFLL